MKVQWQKALVYWLLVGWGLICVPAVMGAVRITQLRVSLPDSKTGVSYGRFGHWLAVRIVVEADEKEDFAGQVIVSTPDADGIVQEVVAEPELRLSPSNRQQVVWAYVQCGHGKLRVHVRDQTRRIRASFTYPDDTGQSTTWQLVPPSVMRIVTLGPVAGLGEDAAQWEGAPDPGYRVSVIASPEYLPEHWFGYDGVQVVVLATGGEMGLVWLEALQSRPRLAEALRQWVQQGGHLVVCAATRAEQVVSSEHFPLADILPGEWIVGRRVYPELLVGVREVTASRYREPTALPTLRAEWAEFRKKPTASQRAFAAEPMKPAVLVWPYGLGQVTLVAFETNVGNFTQWDGRSAFWEWLLETEPLATRQVYRTALTLQRQIEPLTQLVHQLEQFQTQEMPFALVAGLMFGYLLVAGPLDYLIMARWLRRPGLAWVTFPLMVGLVTAAAWYSARAIHGDQLVVHELVLCDLEMEIESSGTAKPVRASGSSWLVLKSPRLQAYSLGLADHQHAAVAGGLSHPWTDTLQLHEAVLGWTIRPDDDALERGRRESLVQGAVRVWPGRGRLEKVPLQAWSMKTLFGRWLISWQSPPPWFEARIRAPDLNTVRGEITWRAPWPLLAAELTYGSRVWPLGDLSPGQTVVVQRNDVGLLERQRLYPARELRGTPAAQPSLLSDVPLNKLYPWSHELAETLRQLTFQRLLIVGRRQSPSPYLPFLDQSRRLRYGQAVVTGYLPPAELPLSQLRQLSPFGSTLASIEPAAPGLLRRLIFMRIYLPLSGQD